MKLIELRKNTGIVSELQKLYGLPDIRFLRQCLDDEHPLYAGCTDKDPGSLARHLGRIEGYEMALRNIDMAIVPLTPQKPLIETFEPITPTTNQPGNTSTI